MKVLVTGANGQLGYDVMRHLEARGVEYRGVDIEDFNLTNERSTTSWISSYNPACVVHCAAYTAVDRAEEEKELCYAVNVEGTRNVASACREIGAKMLYVSTDYVFDGFSKQGPWEVDDKKDPQSQYGYTKYMGELAVQEMVENYFIVRISWVFGKNGGNFVKTMLRLAKTKDEISVVSDQVGSPTYTYDAAKLMCDILETEKYGVYHATNEGVLSWYNFACEIFGQAGIGMKVNPITTDEYPAAAVRPKNSQLSKKSIDDAGFARLPAYKDALARFLKEIENDA